MKLTNGRYIYIGSEIYEFDTDDEIVAYHSKIGNSDVPYPVALGKTNAYFLLDAKYVPRSEFREDIDWEDAYKDYYHGPREVVGSTPILLTKERREARKKLALQRLAQPMKWASTLVPRQTHRL